MCLSWQNWNGFRVFIKSLESLPSLELCRCRHGIQGEPMPARVPWAVPPSPCHWSSVTSPSRVFVFILCILKHTVNPVFSLLHVFPIIILNFLMFLYPFIFPGDSSDVPIRPPVNTTWAVSFCSHSCPGLLLWFRPHACPCWLLIMTFIYESSPPVDSWAGSAQSPSHYIVLFLLQALHSFSELLCQESFLLYFFDFLGLC